MGGGMIYGEPCSYGFGYPYGASGTPGFNSLFPPRRQSRFWSDESYPDEFSNLARKRKLDGVKGDPLPVANGKNVREMLVEDPFVTKIPITHSSQAKGNASTNGGNSPPASPGTRNVSANLKSSEGRTVIIPVVFSSESATQQPVLVVPAEGTKKQKRSFTEEAAAVLIQSVYRGYEVRRTKPLEYMRRINNIRNKLREFEGRLSDAETVEKLRTELNARLRITEGIMVLLLELDSIQGVHSDVRVWRKAVSREVVSVQERVDALFKGEERLETQSLSVEGHDVDTPMALDEVDVGKNDEVMSDFEHQKTPLETEDKLAAETVLDRLKLVDGKAVSLLEQTAVVKDDRDDVDEVVEEVSDLENDQSTTNLRNAIAQQESGEEAGQTETTLQDADKNERAQSEAKISTSQHCEVFTVNTRGRDDDFRHESSISCAVDEANVAIQMKCSEASGTSVAGTTVNGEQGMEVDMEDYHPQDQGDECVRNSEELDCTMRTRPQYQEKMKDFLREITSPPTSPHPHHVRLNEAEEMDCRGAPSSCSDVKEDAGSPVRDNGRMNRAEEPCTSPDSREYGEAAPSTGPPRTPRESDEACEGTATSQRTERIEQDPLYLKLSEENKMLKLLLLDVMKWNQFQANSMKNVTERLGKLEDKLTMRDSKSRKNSKSSSKPKLQRCTRSKLERRSRR